MAESWPELKRSAVGNVSGSKGEDGLPVWMKQNRNIHEHGYRAWYTMAFHHVPEDWPQMPTMWQTLPCGRSISTPRAL